MAVPATISYEARIDFVDHAGKTSAIIFRVSAADYAAWLTDTTAGNVRTLMNAYEALSLDNITAETVSARAASATSVPAFPSDENAVNSAKLIVLMQDAVNGEPTSNTIPARNAANYTSAGGTVITGTGVTAEITALVTQITAHQRSSDGNGVLIKSIKVVGRGTAA